MKKILMLTAVATMCASTLADAQFYEMQLTVRTTVTAAGKVKMVSCDCRTDENAEDLYRRQGIVKIKGVIWGCDCGTLTKGVPFTTVTDPYGYFFWNETTHQPLNVRLEWVVANRIDRTATKAEVVWRLTSEDGTFDLNGSGFGMLKDTVVRKPICQMVTSSFKNVSGGFAGWMMPGAVVTTEATSGSCSWCEKIEGTAPVAKVAPALGICSECTAATNSASAAYGNWKVKYNAMVSKKMSAKQDSGVDPKITDFYNFPDYVKAVME